MSEPTRPCVPSFGTRQSPGSEANVPVVHHVRVRPLLPDHARRLWTDTQLVLLAERVDAARAAWAFALSEAIFFPFHRRCPSRRRTAAPWRSTWAGSRFRRVV